MTGRVINIYNIAMVKDLHFHFEMRYQNAQNLIIFDRVMRSFLKKVKII